MEMLETRWTTGGSFLALLSSSFLAEFSLPAAFPSREVHSFTGTAKYETSAPQFPQGSSPHRDSMGLWGWS